MTDVLDRTALRGPTGRMAGAPGLGGVRWMPYPDEPATTAEACRPARVMMLKNALVERRAAAVLADHGVTYVPDFLLNAGGVVHIHAVRSAWGDDRLEEAVRKIGGRVHDVLALARSSGKLPIDVAEERAAARLGRSIGLPA